MKHASEVRHRQRVRLGPVNDCKMPRLLFSLLDIS